MQKTNINPAIFQPFLESAANAGAKGQAQYFTPPEWGRALSQALPRFRPVIVDLNAGAGHLLAAAARPSTNHLLGCDIDPSSSSSSSSSSSVPVRCSELNVRCSMFTADITRAFPLMKAVKFTADLFVLNPPWDLHWYRKHLALLADSDLATVRAAFGAHDGRTAKDAIDSTVATLAIALDLCSEYGEGFLIANEATLQRLLLGPGAPHRALAHHIWAHVVIEGNICQSAGPTLSQTLSNTFRTGVIYFARSHDAGPSPSAICHLPSAISEVAAATADLYQRRGELRLGADIRSYAKTDQIPENWQAISEEWRRLHPNSGLRTQDSGLRTHHWNLWLDRHGTIRTDLSLFDTRSGRVTKAEADTLFALGGRKPIQLVMHRQQRAALMRACGLSPVQGSMFDVRCSMFPTLWRVDPALLTAVNEAVAQYHAVRAPLYPLSPIMRLGYLDEHDEITCSRDLSLPVPVPVQGSGFKVQGSKFSSQVCFRADRNYPLRSTTVAVKRSGQKRNLEGYLDQVEWDGQELAFFITDDYGVERLFMEGRLRQASVRISILKAGEKPGRQDEKNLDLCAIDFTLHDLVDRFIIPDVLDVARINPEGYQRNLALLAEIESLTV